ISNREDSIRLTIINLESGVFMSQRKAAAKYNIPRLTLTSRLASSSTTREFIINWILEEGARGYSPTHAQTQEIASRLL
ncbi:hypothetical protein K432DRAFT_314535, partial [Lepidopterella palustris CBS 459.81]